MKIAIAQTWDGHPARAHERASIVVAAQEQGLCLTVEAPFHDDPPPEAPPGPLWGLWEHEVVELFIVGPHQRYLEVELGPHGHHLALRLEGRRNPVEHGMAMDFEVHRDARSWTGRALLPWAWLPPRPWTWNAYAIHGQGSLRRHLAAHPVPGDQPDFHRLERFAPWPPPPSS